MNARRTAVKIADTGRLGISCFIEIPFSKLVLFMSRVVLEITAFSGLGNTTAKPRIYARVQQQLRKIAPMLPLCWQVGANRGTLDISERTVFDFSIATNATGVHGLHAKLLETIPVRRKMRRLMAVLT
jgi:hypothetical protein